jgi:hypothetical protein
MPVNFRGARTCLISTQSPFAYYEQEDGFGWIEPGGMDILFCFAEKNHRAKVTTWNAGDIHGS